MSQSVAQSVFTDIPKLLPSISTDGAAKDAQPHSHGVFFFFFSKNKQKQIPVSQQSPSELLI